ncbi:MAG: TatD family hydrolase, partial [Bacteroidota bacterium]
MQADSFINIHTHHKPKLKEEFALRNAYLCLTSDQILNLPYAVSAGLHPWHLHQMTVNECSDRLIEIASSDKVLAIGEIGIDRAIDIPVNIQLNYFDTQLNVARALQKPVIIHAVRSYSDLMPFLKKTKVPFIFHQFQGNEQQARELLKYNAYLSFGKNLFEPKSEQTFKNIPVENIFLETDTAHHIHIADIYRKAAELKELDIDELKSIVFHN